MKKLYTALTLCLLFSACGGGSEDDTTNFDPANVDFENPTGILTNDNIDEVATAAYDSFVGTTVIEPFIVTVPSADDSALSTIAQMDDLPQQCFTNLSDDNASGTIGYGCLDDLADIGGDCSLNGSADFTTEDSIITFTFRDDIQSLCDNLEYLPTGTFSTNGDETACIQSTLVENTFGNEFAIDTCFDEENTQIRVMDETYNIDGGDVTCDGATVTIVDADGPSEVTCEVTSEGSCSDASDVIGVENCAFD